MYRRRTVEEFSDCCLSDISADVVEFQNFLNRFWLDNLHRRALNSSKKTVFVVTALGCSFEIQSGDDLSEVVSNSGSRAFGASIIALRLNSVGQSTPLRSLTFDEVFILRRHRVRSLLILDNHVWREYEVSQMPLFQKTDTLPPISDSLAEQVEAWAFPERVVPANYPPPPDPLTELFTPEELERYELGGALFEAERASTKGSGYQDPTAGQERCSPEQPHGGRH